MQLTHSVDMRAGDITTLASLCKSYMYQDMLEKPSELVLYMKVEDGGAWDFTMSSINLPPNRSTVQILLFG